MNKLDVYAGLGVTEVWAASRFFPDLDFAVLAEHVAMPDQDDAVRAYWVRLRG